MLVPTFFNSWTEGYQEPHKWGWIPDPGQAPNQKSIFKKKFKPEIFQFVVNHSTHLAPLSEKYMIEYINWKYKTKNENKT